MEVVDDEDDGRSEVYLLLTMLIPTFISVSVLFSSLIHLCAEEGWARDLGYSKSDSVGLDSRYVRLSFTKRRVGRTNNCS